MPRTASAGLNAGPAWSSQERATLLELQANYLQYFLDNQTADGLFLDRQANFRPRRSHGLCSTAATGMGFIALALASDEPHYLLSRCEAITRIRTGVETVLEQVPHTAGVLPHFVDSDTKAVYGDDARSTVDTAWLAAGALWAADFFDVGVLHQLANRLFARIDWSFWTAACGLIRHGADAKGRLFPCCWDRLNGETVFQYVLAAGAAEGRHWPAENWNRLGRYPGEAGGLRFGSADLGLFVFQYGLDLLNLEKEPLPGADLLADAALAAEANARVCRSAADRFSTYQRFWGLSAGDGPGPVSDSDAYLAYSPAEPLDGTAHVTATLASLAHRPALVWENVCQANAGSPDLKGRYGFSNVNLDRNWVSRDVVGIDAGAAVLALDNCLTEDRVRGVFHRLPAVRHGLARVRHALPKERAA